jgi:hypothetical protein
MGHSNQFLNQQLSHKEVEASKYSEGGHYLWNVPARTGSHFTSCACKMKSYLVLKTVSKSLKKARLEMWFDGQNESFNVKIYIE